MGQAVRTGPTSPASRGDRQVRTIRRVGFVVGLIFIGSGVGFCSGADWGPGLPLLLVGAALVITLGRARRREQAAALALAQWPLPRVRETLTSAGAADASEVEQVRALRRSDPRLGLADAVSLVRSAHRPGAAGAPGAPGR